MEDKPAAEKSTEVQQVVDSAAARTGIQTSAPMDVDAAPAATGDETPAASDEPDMVLAEEVVKAELLQQLTDEFGFGKNRAVRALLCSGNASVEAAVNWLAEHEDDEDLDEALLVPKATPRRTLTAEEVRVQAEELRLRAKEKREREEKELEATRERERIRIGKEMSLAARAEEDQKLKRMADERRREKEEDRKAREKIRQKLEEDRRARRRAMGLPEDLTEEEKQKEEERLKQQAEEEARRKLPFKPITAIATMRSLLVDMKKAHANDGAKFTTACKTLMAYCRNVYNNPDDDAKRAIKLSNKALQERVLCVTNGRQFLETVGFKEDSDAQALVLSREDVNREVLVGAGEVLDNALTNPMFGVL